MRSVTQPAVRGVVRDGDENALRLAGTAHLNLQLAQERASDRHHLPAILLSYVNVVPWSTNEPVRVAALSPLTR